MLLRAALTRVFGFMVASKAVVLGTLLVGQGVLCCLVFLYLYMYT